MKHQSHRFTQVPRSARPKRGTSFGGLVRPRRDRIFGDTSRSSASRRRSGLKIRNYGTFVTWKTSHLNNERKLLNWVRTSLAMITLGFVVQRFDIFLRRATGTPTPAGSSDAPSLVFTLVSIGLFAIGGIIIVVSTIEFFRDRRRIDTADTASSTALFVLILAVLVFLVLVVVGFVLPLKR